MLTILGTIAAFLIILRINLPFLIRNKLKREMFVFFTILLISTGTLLLDGFGKTIPNPLIVIEFVFEPIGNMIFGDV